MGRRFKPRSEGFPVARHLNLLCDIRVGLLISLCILRCGANWLLGTGTLDPIIELTPLALQHTEYTQL